METHADGHDMPFIMGVLTDVYVKRGSLLGVMFRLYRSKESISVPGWGDRKGQRTRTEKWLVRIEPAAEWVRHQLRAARADALAMSSREVVDAETGEILTAPAPMPALPAPAATAPRPATQQQPAARPATQPARQAAPAAAPAKPLTNSQKAAAQTQAPANGNGQKLASVEKLAARWGQLWQWKIALGIQFDAIAQGATPEQYVAAGRALHAALITRAKEILPADFGWPDNDDTIDAAVNMLANIKEDAAVTLEAA
jgi:hypothetical protein